MDVDVKILVKGKPGDFVPSIFGENIEIQPGEQAVSFPDGKLPAGFWEKVGFYQRVNEQCLRRL